jgi:hypothetical protein
MIPERDIQPSKPRRETTKVKPTQVHATIVRPASDSPIVEIVSGEKTTRGKTG